MSDLDLLFFIIDAAPPRPTAGQNRVPEDDGDQWCPQCGLNIPWYEQGYSEAELAIVCRRCGHALITKVEVALRRPHA